MRPRPSPILTRPRPPDAPSSPLPSALPSPVSLATAPLAHTHTTPIALTTSTRHRGTHLRRRRGVDRRPSGAVLPGCSVLGTSSVSPFPGASPSSSMDSGVLDLWIYLSSVLSISGGLRICLASASRSDLVR
jgi:hypothetical protein